MSEQSNSYLNQVVQEQAQTDKALKRRNLAPAGAAAAAPAPARRMATLGASLRAAEPDDSGVYAMAGLSDAGGGGEARGAIEYRITGFWRWKTVVVPPNVYVVHTRRDHKEPLDIGLGISFRFDPYTDAFLVIPAVVQTLLINARCICQERQGILVQAYVQWVVDDIGIAYKKLDFSDPYDPMRIVNIQLREQAEAAIKDKVTTMSIDDVLSDKQPIIEELTHRLRTVAEGNRESGASGLGLKIVTVQIKEAVVSSTRLWENLQKPFRTEREKLARMAELETQKQIARQEQLNRQQREREALEIEGQLSEQRAVHERTEYDRQQTERARRLEVEEQAERAATLVRTTTERARREAELELTLHQLELESRKTSQELEAVRREMELDRVRGERDVARRTLTEQVEGIAHDARSRREERDVALFQQRRTAENAFTTEHVQAQLIERLPEIAAALPRPKEVRTVSIGPGADGASAGLVGFLAGALNLAEDALRSRASTNGHAPEPAKPAE